MSSIFIFTASSSKTKNSDSFLVGGSFLPSRNLSSWVHFPSALFSPFKIEFSLVKVSWKLFNQLKLRFIVLFNFLRWIFVRICKMKLKIACNLIIFDSVRCKIKILLSWFELLAIFTMQIFPHLFCVHSKLSF